MRTRDYNCVVLRRRVWYLASMLQQRLARRIAELRLKRGLTQVQLAKAAGCSPDFISRVERGVNAPSVAWLEGFARALKVEVVDLFRFSRRKPRKG